MMNRTLSITCALLAAGLMPSVARAQAPPCPGASQQSYSGTMPAGQSLTMNLNLQPCEQVRFVVSTSSTNFGAAVGMDVYNSESPTPRKLYGTNWPTYTAGNNYNLPLTPPWYDTIRGTRGVEGLPGTAVLWNHPISDPMTYTVTVYKSPRADYNIGGVSFATAPLVPLSTKLYGSLSDMEPGQYYRIHLAGNETIFMKGQALGFEQWGANFYVDLHDASQTYITTMVSEAAYGLRTFPDPSPVITFTNPSAQEADFYLRVSCRWWPIHDFQFSVEPRVFKLFLDEDGDFNPSAPVNDIDTFVPGSTHGGNSVPLPQTLHLVAAYTDAAGTYVLPPPNPGTQVTFSLTDVSAFTGVAMNGSSADTTPDYNLPTSTATFGTDKTARVTLLARDYGGWAVAHAEHGTTTATPMRLPRDEDGNLLPDGGWSAGGTHVSQAGLTDGADGDVGPSGNQNVGDALTAFEEYRGFFVQGQHTRTDPWAKHLFVQSSLMEGVGYATSLPISLVQVLATEIAAASVINANYVNNGNGAQPVHMLQRALKIQDGGYSSTDAGATQPILPGPVVPANVIYINIYMQTIRQTSPTHNNKNTPDSVDSSKTSQTIAHEIGHGITLAHIDVNKVCPPPVWTVMVTNYFVQSNGHDQWLCAWQNIPFSYLQNELDTFRLR